MTERLPSETISACIVCRNEADRIIPCLESVRWVDEVIVLDLESTDGSARIADESGARVFSHPPVPIVELVRNRAAEEATGDWILVLDPDERVSPGLAARLSSLREREDIDAVVVPRMNIDFGHAPTGAVHRYEQQLRMYRRSRVAWPTFPNALPDVPEERLHRVESRDDLVLVHDRSRCVEEVIERVLRYGPAQGRAMVDAGEVFTARAMLSAMTEKVYREFIAAEPWRDGVPGFVRAGTLVAFRFYVWVAFWEASGARRTATDDRYVRRLGLVLRTLGLTLTLGSASRRLSRAVGRLRR